jgi:hypothetical protein
MAVPRNEDCPGKAEDIGLAICCIYEFLLPAGEDALVFEENCARDDADGSHVVLLAAIMAKCVCLDVKVPRTRQIANHKKFGKDYCTQDARTQSLGSNWNNFINLA